jgi:hypothetical protein
MASKYQSDAEYRARIKARNKEFQRCLREDSRRMDWLRSRLEGGASPTLAEIRAIVENDLYGTTLPNGLERRQDFTYCENEEL